MATDFPNAPTVGQEFTGLGGITYVWDGVKWTNGVCGGSVSNALDSIIAGQCIGLTNTPGPPQTLTINALIPCIQTPWLQNIDGGLHQLSNAIGIGVGGAAPSAGIRVYSGGIGINNAAPTSPQITMTGRATDNLPGLFITAIPATAQPMISINNDIRQCNIIYYGSGTANPGAFSFECAGGNDYIRFYTSGGTAGERMRITNVGQVGIGTSTPDNLGAGYFGLTLNGPNSGTLSIQNNGTGILRMYGDTTGIVFDGMGLDMRFVDISERMRIVASTGYVGIGTPAPDALLTFAPGVGQKVQWYQTGNQFKFGVSIATASSGYFTTQFYEPSAYVNVPLFQFGSMNSTDGVTFSPILTVHGSGHVGVGSPAINPIGILDVRAIAGDSTGYMYYTGNVGNILPAFGSSNFALGWNFQAGLQEIDFFNTTSIGPATGGFRWYQMTSAGAATYLCGVDNTGNFFADRFEAASAYFGPAITNGAPMFFVPTGDPTPNMAVETMLFWADTVNNRVVLAFRTGAGNVVRGYIPVA